MAIRTAQDIKDIEHRLEVMLDMWDKHSLREIAEKLGITKQRVSQLAMQLRTHGVPVPPKLRGFDWIGFAKKHKDYGKDKTTD